MNGQNETENPEALSGSSQEPVVIPHFVCTNCRLQFAGQDKAGSTAVCPECNSTYEGFLTPLIRCGSFALAYWLRGNPGEIRQHESAV